MPCRSCEDDEHPMPSKGPALQEPYPATFTWNDTKPLPKNTYVQGGSEPKSSPPQVSIGVFCDTVQILEKHNLIHELPDDILKIYLTHRRAESKK